MAIFARLVMMLFSIVFSSGVGGYAASAANPYDRSGMPLIFGAIAGAVVGIFVGKILGSMVVGKPPTG